MEEKSTRKRWTYAEFARLPESGSTRYEIIDDELFVTPSPGTRHQRVVKRLVRALDDFVEAHELGEVFISPLDVLFVRSDRKELLSDRGVEGPPDLVVEVLSPSSATRDRGIKLERYRHFGVPECWIVDLDERTLEVWKLAEGATKPLVIPEGGTLRWQPVAGGPVLDVPVVELFEE